MTEYAATQDAPKSPALSSQPTLDVNALGRMLRVLLHKAVDPVSKRLFRAAYVASHNAHWQAATAEQGWRSLGGIIEYSPRVLVVIRDGADPLYLLAFRSCTMETLRRVTVTLKTKKSGSIRTQTVTLDRLDRTPVLKMLDLIPAKPGSATDTGRRRLGDIYIKLTGARASDGTDLVDDRKLASIVTSVHATPTEDAYVERWGQYWHTGLIAAEQESTRLRCYHDLIHAARKVGRPLTLRRLLYRVLSGRPGLAIQFWSHNLFDAKGMRTKIAQAAGTGATDR